MSTEQVSDTGNTSIGQNEGRNARGQWLPGVMPAGSKPFTPGHQLSVGRANATVHPDYPRSRRDLLARRIKPDDLLRMVDKLRDKAVEGDTQAMVLIWEGLYGRTLTEGDTKRFLLHVLSVSERYIPDDDQRMAFYAELSSFV
jgi:hypothetical protein